MSLKINGTGRLCLQELNDYRDNSGITERQYQIIKRRYYDRDEPNTIMICTELCISESTYRRELHKALDAILHYEFCKRAH